MIRVMRAPIGGADARWIVEPEYMATQGDMPAVPVVVVVI